MPSDPPLPRGTLRYQRKQAKRLLRAFQAGDAEARARAYEALGERASLRFKLSDAQHVVAVEHGERGWPDLRRRLLGPAPAARPVARIGVAGVSTYEEQARRLGDAVRAGGADATRRVLAHLPRLANEAGNPALATLPERDARLVVAREYGYPTWRELVEDVAEARRQHAAAPGSAITEALACIRAGDARGLWAVLAREPGLVHAPALRGETLLGLVAQPGDVGHRLGHDLGVDRACVEVLIDAGSDLDGPLGLAACFDRVELVELVLDAGAHVDATGDYGITPLQAAIYHGAAAAGDVLARVAVVPDALYVAAGAGLVERLPRWFGPDGRPTAEAYAERPNLADVGWPPGLPPTDDPKELLGEALTLACYSGRVEAAAWLVDHGADVDAQPYLGMTGLHFAVITGQLAMITWLLDHGADPTLRDAQHHSPPAGWAEHEGNAQVSALFERRAT